MHIDYNSKIEGGSRLGKKRPFLTIVTVLLNGKEGLDKTIQSVANQTSSDYEYIVIDGGSSDGSIDILQKNDKLIDYWVSEPDFGIYDAMNKALRIANGRYIFYLGDSDLLLYKSLDSIINLTCKKKYEKPILFPVVVNGKLKFPLNINLKIPIPHHQGAMMPTTLLKSNGGFDLSYKIHSDFDCMLKTIGNYGFRYVKIPFCVFTTGGCSNSGDKWIDSIKELFLIYKKNKGNIFSIGFIATIIRPVFYKFKEIIF